MGTQWARQEAKKNEIALALETLGLWLQNHRQAAIWGGVGLLAAALFAAMFIHRSLAAREDSWGKLAIAQSYAYSGRADSALKQLQEITEIYGTSLASGYSLLTTGDILYQQGKYKEATQALQKLLESLPGHKTLTPLALANLCAGQEAAQDCKSAAETAERFLESYQDHFLAPQVHACLARCLSVLGQADKAKAAYERMVFLYPETYWAQWAKSRLKG